MITTAEIQFFQPHKYTLFEFVPGVNIIKGTSHKGKSSAYRALTWCLINRPTGFGFRSHFAGKADTVSSAIEFDNGDYAIRKRDTKFNGYEITDEQEFVALRSDVPEEVFAVTQMDARNLRSQGDGYFILNETPGIAGKRLNEVVGMEIINEKIAKAKSLVSERKAKRDSIKEEIKTTEDKLEELASVPVIAEIFENIDLLLKDLNTTKQKHSNLVKVLNRIADHNQNIANMEEFLTRKPLVDEVKILILDRNKTIADRNILKSINASIKHKKEIIEDNETWLECKTVYGDIKSLLVRRSEIKNKRQKLSTLCHGIKVKRKTQQSADARLKKLKVKRKELQKELDSMTETCPKCGSYKQHWRK